MEIFRVGSREKGEVMKGMTIKQIANTCGVAVQTVRDWLRSGTESVLPDPRIVSAHEKVRKAGHGKSAIFDLEEVVAIVRAGGRHTLAALLQENAKKSKADHRVTRLPNGVQLTELRRIYGPREAARRIDFAIGYSRREAVATPEQARDGFEMVRNDLKQKGLDFSS